MNTCVVYRSINFSQLLVKQGGSVSTADLCLLQSPVAAALTRGNASSSFSAPSRAERFAITDNTRKPCHVISQRCHVLSTLKIYNMHSVLKKTSTYSLCRKVGNIIWLGSSSLIKDEFQLSVVESVFDTNKPPAFKTYEPFIQLQFFINYRL